MGPDSRVAPRPFHVFIDRGCDLGSEAGFRRLSPKMIDIRRDHDEARLARGGVLLLGSRTADGRPAFGALSELRHRYPHLVVYVCTRGDDLALGWIVRYTRAGADRFVTVGCERELADLVECVAERIQAPPPALEMCDLQVTMPASRGLRIALHCLRNAHRQQRLPGVAEHFGVALRTLLDYLVQSGLPCASDVCRVGRFLHLVELVRRGVRSPCEQAQRLGFSSATGMRKAKWQLRSTMATDSRTAAFVGRFPSLAYSLSARSDE